MSSATFWILLALPISILGCEINNINPNIIPDKLGPDVKIFTSVTVSGDIDENSILIEPWESHNFTAYETFLRIEVDKTQDGQGGIESTVNIYPGEKFRDFLDIDYRYNNDGTASAPAYFSYVCDELTRRKNLAITVSDSNNRGPVFTTAGDTIELTITTAWDKRIPINWNHLVQITDQDRTFEHADPNSPNNLQIEDSQNALSFVYMFRDDLGFIPNYTSDLEIFISDDFDLTEARELEIEITAKDNQADNGESKFKILLKIEPTGNYVPKFGSILYFSEMTAWPTVDTLVVTDPTPIFAKDPENDEIDIIFALENFDCSDCIEIASQNGQDVTLKFIKAITQDDGISIIKGEIVARKANDLEGKLTSNAGIVIQLPFSVPKELPKFTAPYFPKNIPSWDDDQSITVDNILEDFDPINHLPNFEMGAIYPLEFSGNIEIPPNPGNPNSLNIVLTGISDDMPSFPNVVLVEVLATLANDPERVGRTTVALYFPEKPLATTPMPTTFETTNPEVTDCPTPCDCSSDTTYPSTAITDPQTTDDEPTTSCPEPITCPPTSCEPISDPPSTASDATTVQSTTDTTCPPCSTEPASCPTQTSVTCPDCSETCPTQTSVTCPDCSETCPTQTSVTSPDCSNTCPTQTSVTCPDCSETCPTQTSVTCPDCSETCPTQTSVTCPDCSETCQPCTTEPASCPTQPTCEPCNCSTTEDPDSEECSSSNTGLIAGIAVVSVLFAGSLGAAAFLFWKLKNIAPTPSFGNASPSVPSSSNPKPPNSFGRKNSFGKIDTEDPTNIEESGWRNPSFTSTEPASSSGLEQVVTHPEPIASTSKAASPYMSTPVVDAASTPMKSSLAKPKEIAPDYDEGMKMTEPAQTKPKSGVKIADEVEIIDNETPIEDESERL